MATPPIGPAELRAWRRSRNWPQSIAASWWGVSERQWRRYETGHSRIPLPLARRVHATPHRDATEGDTHGAPRHP